MAGSHLCLVNLQTFETSDLPEVDQHYFPVDETTDSVETIHISANEAFGRFKGSNLDNKSVDFSDRLRNSRRKGYIAWKGEREENKEETPVKKYQRLNCEVRELLDDVSAARKNKDSGLGSQTLESLASQVEALHKHLLEMRLEQVLGREVVEVMTDPQAATRQRLTAQLRELQSASQPVSATNSKDNSNKDEKRLSYNVLIKQENEKLKEAAELQKLQARIAVLEAYLGPSPEEFSILKAETGGKRTLTEAVSVLSAKTALLDPKNLDHFEGRLAVVQQKLSQAGEEEGAAGGDQQADPDTVRRIADLHKLAERAGPVLTEIPELIDRLEVLSPLHAQAGEMSQSILELETVQQQMVAQLGNNSRLLREVSTHFNTNLASIEKNLESLNQRIEALKQKK